MTHSVIVCVIGFFLEDRLIKAIYTLQAILYLVTLIKHTMKSNIKLFNYPWDTYQPHT